MPYIVDTPNMHISVCAFTAKAALEIKESALGVNQSVLKAARPHSFRSAEIASILENSTA